MCPECHTPWEGLPELSSVCDTNEKENNQHQSPRELRSCKAEKTVNAMQVKERGKSKASFEGASNPRKKRLRSSATETNDVQLTENTTSQPPRELRRSQRMRNSE